MRLELVTVSVAAWTPSTADLDDGLDADDAEAQLADGRVVVRAAVTTADPAAAATAAAAAAAACSHNPFEIFTTEYPGGLKMGASSLHFYESLSCLTEKCTEWTLELANSCWGRDR